MLRMIHGSANYKQIDFGKQDYSSRTTFIH